MANAFHSETGAATRPWSWTRVMFVSTRQLRRPTPAHAV